MTVWVSSGCRDKGPWTRALSRQKCKWYLSSAWPRRSKAKVWQGGFFRGLSPSLYVTVSSVCVCVSIRLPLPVRTPEVLDEGPSYFNRITSFYLSLCWVSIATQAFSLASGGFSSLLGPGLLTAVASLAVECGLWGVWAQAVGHGLSRSTWHLGSSGTRDRTWVSCIGRWILYHKGSPELPLQKPCLQTQ